MDCKRVIVCFFLLMRAASAATFNVGDKLGWTFPPLGDIAYRTWAAQQSFAVGDTLVFNFTAGVHNVAEVGKADYDACTTQSLISISTNVPTNIKLSTAGEHYYICTIPGHCGAGMKLAINVSAATTTTPAPQQPTPVSAPSSSVTHVVGDRLGWLVPPGGSIAYTTWASQQTFTQGDVLVFNFTAGFHNVAEVSKADYDTCNAQSPISFSTSTPTNITLTSAGEHYYICTIPRHCGLGMKVAINVSAATTTAPAQPPPVAPVSTPASAPVPSSSPSRAQSPAPSTSSSTQSPASSPSSTQSPASSPSSTQSPPPSPSRTPATYMVGDALGWTVPPGGPIAYQTWANEKTFIVGDKLVFNFTNGRHNVAQLTSKVDYDSCNTSSASTPITTSPASITLSTPGEHFYFCTFPQHCFLGQKLAINVTGAPSSTATSPSGSSTTTPSSSATSPGGSVPPSPSSASIVAAAALPFTLLSIAFTLFY